MRMDVVLHMVLRLANKETAWPYELAELLGFDRQETKTEADRGSF